MKTFLKPYVKTFAGDTETPITLYYKYVGQQVGFLLESRGKGQYSFMGRCPDVILEGKEKLNIYENGTKTTKEGKLLDNVKEYIQKFQVKNNTQLPFIGGAVGCIAYDVIRQYEKLPEENPDVLNMPDIHFMIVKEVVAYDHLHDRIHIIVLEEDNEEGGKKAYEKIEKIQCEIMQEKHPILLEEKLQSNIHVVSNTTKEHYMDMVKKAKKYIYDGDIFQVVLSQRLTAHTDENPFILYRKLREINPSPYLYYFNFGKYQIAGSSPEMLVEMRKNRIYNCPIAGTRKRGKNVEEDALFAQDLKNDPKEKAEHVMLVDLARNDMGKVSEIGSVEVTSFMNVQNYSHVMHMVSMVEGNKAEKEDAFSVLASFLPAGTLSGAPKIRAMEIIEELEQEKRGVYGGAVGYFSFDGDMDFCIAIRTMIIKDEKVYMQAGAGIVADSDPEAEFEESHNKVRALVKTIGGDI